MCLFMATPKGLEPSTSCVTGRRSTLLNYGAICVTYLCADGVTNHPLVVIVPLTNQTRLPVLTFSTLSSQLDNFTMEG